jgi:general secretion pathway protein C
MSALLRPSLHVLSLFLVACTGLLLAHSVNTVLSLSLLPLPSPADILAARPAAPGQPPSTPLSLERLSRQTGLRLEEPLTVSSTTPEDAAPIRLPGLRLLGTLVASRDDTSLASVYEDAVDRTTTVWPGREFQGAEVLAIERTRVLLRGSGRLAFIDFAPAPVSAGSAVPPPSSQPGASIQQVGAHAYEVPRHEVDSALANMHQLAMQARVVPSFIHGAPQGFKLFAIRPDSFFTRLGLRNGDTLRRINGFTLDSPDNALAAYQRLQDASLIELEVVRDGQPVLQTYRIR